MRDDDWSSYSEPSRSTRFRKGQSGNPNGRPRRARAEDSACKSLVPTMSTLLAEAERSIRLREGDTVTEITAREAVIRAAFNKAIKGDTNALRDLMHQLSHAEEIALAERKEIFDLWSKYKAEGLQKMVAAISAGEPAPTELPHPEDVLLDHSTYRVRIDGPMAADTKPAYDRIFDIREYLLAMSWYHGEQEVPVDDKRVGYFFALAMLFDLFLPKRQQWLTVGFEQCVSRYWPMAHKSREIEAARCAAALSFRLTRIKLSERRPHMLPLEKIGLRERCGIIEPIGIEDRAAHMHLPFRTT